MNKYYEMFINDNVDETLLKINSNALSFEDHFWLCACLAVYYDKHNDFYMHKKYLSAACDLNYYFNALVYFDAYKVLPNRFQKYLVRFEHKMKDDKLEAMIDAANKKDKRKLRNTFMIYSFASLLIIPLMFLLVFAFKIDTTVAAVISIVILLIGQVMVNPMVRNKRQKEAYRRDSQISKAEREYFNFLVPFNSLVNDEKYLALIKADTDE